MMAQNGVLLLKESFMSSDCADEGNDGYKSLTKFDFEELMNEVGLFANELDYLVYQYPGEE